MERTAPALKTGDGQPLMDIAGEDFGEYSSGPYLCAPPRLLHLGVAPRSSTMKAAALLVLLAAAIGKIAAQDTGVTITLTRYMQSTTCNDGARGGCKVLADGDDPALAVDSAGNPSSCVNSTIIVDRQNMGTCTRSLLGGDPHCESQSATPPCTAVHARACCACHRRRCHAVSRAT